MLIKSEAFFGVHKSKDIDRQPPSSRQVALFKGSKEIRQTHESVLIEAINMLTDLIPEQYKMKIEGRRNPVETEFLTETRLDIIYEKDADTNILFKFDFDREALDKYERHKLSSKLIRHFNESPLPVVVHSLDSSRHIVCIRDRKEFEKLRLKYEASQRIKPQGSIQKAIPFIRDNQQSRCLPKK